MTVDAEILSALRETARRFSQREVEPMVGTERRDGDLSALPALLARAGLIGLIVSADAEGAEHELGIWGQAGSGQNDVISVALLEEVAVECAGFAACLHHVGLGTLELTQVAAEVPAPVAVALFGRGWRPNWMAFDTPPDGAATLRGGRLNGAASFVHAPPGCAAYVVYAAGPGGWERVVVPRDAPGLIREDVGRRTGLAAVEVAHLSFADVRIPASLQLGPATPTNYLRCLMLGLAAIALGNARGALRAAQQYARERYQGGGIIEGHAAVRMLLGESRSRITAAAAHLAAASKAEGPAATWRALAAKLRVTCQCQRAVSDCLQVLGGYGYMEDYRLEKRLRDAITLKLAAIDPNTLRLLCADDPGGL